MISSSGFAFTGSKITSHGVSCLSGAQTSTSKFTGARNAYLARLSIVKPGQAIDALKDDIRKAQLAGKAIIAETNSNHDYIIKTKAIIEEIEEKT